MRISSTQWKINVAFSGDKACGGKTESIGIENFEGRLSYKYNKTFSEDHS